MLVAPVILSHIYVRASRGTKIFDELPPLPDPLIEDERKKVLRMCFPVDFKLAVKGFAEENDMNSLPLGLRMKYFKKDF